ncbi:hypothetical protein ANO11243_095600 [Dothideomycetidae sp. 11243]|nr:hypothetical protein ANO11243_095600 [fungal sp. No.11243]
MKKNDDELGNTLDDIRKDNTKIVKQQTAKTGLAQKGPELNSSAWMRPEDWRGPIEDACRIERHFNDFGMRIPEDCLFKMASCLGSIPRLIPSYK